MIKQDVCSYKTTVLSVKKKLKTVVLLLATLAIGFSSISASRGEPKAESKGSIWLVVVADANYTGNTTDVTTIEMSSMEQCEAQGMKIKGSEEFRNGVFDNVNYICLRGK